MIPYYDHNGVKIFVGDCREILPTIGRGDLVLTDPPYGIGLEYESYNDSVESWKELMLFLVPWIQQNAQMGVMPACDRTNLQWIYQNIPPDWLMCWYKGSPGHRAFIGFNDWEPLLVYGKTKGLQMHDYFYAQPETKNNGHPCPKPVKWATHLISRILPNGGLVIDPFMGSGTTLVAAKLLGCQAIGCELEPKYADIAIKRLEQEVLSFNDVQEFTQIPMMENI